MKIILRANRRHSRWLRALLIIPSFSFIIAPEIWARTGNLRVASLPRVAAAQTKGAQTPNAASPTLGGQIEDALVKGNIDAVRMLVPKFLNEPNVSADMLLRIGVNLAQHELFPEAADVFGRCVENHPRLFEGYYNFALAKLALRQYPVALATIQQAPRLRDPKKSHAPIFVARSSRTSAKTLKLSRTSPPRLPPPRKRKTMSWIWSRSHPARSYQPAVEVFEKASTFHKNSPFLLLGLSLAQFLGRAERRIDSDLSLRPSSPPRFFACACFARLRFHHAG